MAKVPVRHPGSFGVRRPSRAVDLTADQRRVVEQMALQEREQAMYEQAGLGRADEPYSDPLMGAWNKVVEARIPTENLPGSPTSLGLGVPLTGGPKGLAEWLNTLKYMVEPIMPRDFGASGEHANTPLVGVPKVIGTGIGLGIMGARAARKPLGKVLSRLFGGGDEAVSAVAPVVRETMEAAGRTSRPYFRNIDELETAAQPAWEGGPTIFHGAPGDTGGFSALGEGRMIGSRPAMGNATYTTPDIQFASQYANQSVEAQSAMFRGTHSPPTPSVVQNVRFTGEGAPNLIDYGKAGIDTEVQQAVVDTLGHLDELLAAHPGTLPVLRTELEPLLAKLSDPSTTFADIHGFATHASTGAPGITLREIVEAVARRNTGEGMLANAPNRPPFRTSQLNEMVSIVMSRLSDNLSNAGYHGFVAPADEGFHMAHTAYHGQGADKFGDSIAWFNPSKDLEIVGTAQHNVMGVTHPSGRLGTVPSGYRADNWFGSPPEVAGRLG